uniref:Cell wall surface anchor family protein n=1 Tax=Thiomonas intermedia (strain K12) TaxID=75379 RepID=D5X2J9_THIK1
MNGLSVSGYSANIAAYQAAQNAAACSGWNAGCAAFWWAVNATEQAHANAAYAANVAAAPVLGAALNVAAAASALNSAKGTLDQISSMTGVAQGQTAGSTNAQQALAQTTAQTGVQQGQSATAASTDTGYTSAADARQNALGAAAQQNQNAAVTAAQAGLAGLSAEYSRNAANQIAGYDNAQAQSTGDPDWSSAAQIAQNEVDQQQGIYTYQSNIQNQAIATGNSTAAQANALSPGIANTLNTAAQNAATTQANTTLQNIGNQTGVPQQ